MNEFGPPISWMLRAFYDGDFVLFAGSIVTAVVATLRIAGLTRLIDKGWLKWIAMGLSMIAGVILGAIAEMPWQRVVSTSVNVGWCAIAAWETAVEPIRKRMRDAKAAKVAGQVASSIPAAPFTALTHDIDDPDESGRKP